MWLVQQDARPVDGNLQLVAGLYAEHAPHLDGQHYAPEIVHLPRHAGGPENPLGTGVDRALARR
ncbi:MAG TPA: hypothetical protein VK988_02830 [Acidimicrobiales bacterium]|nr:hypothetical protein [Acidimicrobiales bacterium]